MELTGDEKEAIIELGRKAAPNEACGLLILEHGDRVLCEAPNYHTEPEAGFVVPGQAWREAEDRGEILALWHTHADGTAEFSRADRMACARSGIPWWLCDLERERFLMLLPDAANPGPPALIGRPWSWGELDCLSLAIDYYRTAHGLELESFDRPEEWPPEGPLLIDGAEERGFELFDPKTTAPQVGDLLVIRIRSTHPNHLAVYSGPSEITHHLHGQLSRRQQYAPNWRRVTTALARHPEVAR